MFFTPKGLVHVKTTTVLLLLALFTVCLRFIARRRERALLGPDDWTLLAAVICVLAMYIEGLVCESYHYNTVVSTLARHIELCSRCASLSSGPPGRPWETYLGIVATRTHRSLQSMPVQRQR